MCGIVGVVGQGPVNQDIYDSLLLLQHRGQDSTGIATAETNGVFHLFKAKGQVREAFRTRDMRALLGNIGLGHVRYATKGTASSEEEAQPFYVNAPYGIVLVHNGNLTNTRELTKELFSKDRRHLNTSSDTELLVNVLANELQSSISGFELDPAQVFQAVTRVHERVEGSYATIALIAGYGLLAFRRISERLGDTPWFLRMLRDSAGAAERLTRVLSGSRYIGELMEWIPESVAWLDSEDQLRPRPGVALQEEARAIQTRHETVVEAMRAVRALRRRELLRLAFGAVLGTLTIDELAQGLTTVSEVTIQATLRAVRRDIVGAEDAALDFSVIAMGRFGGGELGFGSDADVLYVYDANGLDPQRAHDLALRLVAGIRTYSEDHRVPFELDADLRPEGRNGPLVRSLDSYTEYYRRWSLSWEAQALLRARGVAGSVKLVGRFMALADEVRYPRHPVQQDLREIKRIKARVENERLPQGADRSRHLKLGLGGLSDVEWLVQLWQHEHAHDVPALRTTSTLDALEAARAAGLVPDAAAQRLHDAWRLASRLRSANTLLSGQTSDVLPTDRGKLDGIGRLLEYPPRSATLVEEEWLRTARRARRDFEKLFYG